MFAVYMSDFRILAVYMSDFRMHFNSGLRFKIQFHILFKIVTFENAVYMQ